MKRLFWVSALLSLQLSLPAQSPVSLHMTLQSNWDVDTLPDAFGFSYNDCWGYTDCLGREYALIGSSGAVHFIDITIPSTPVEVGTFFGGDLTIWRDMKTYRDRAYSVCDACSEGIMVFDLTTLPDTVTKVNQTSAFFGSSHNIFVDTLHGRLYAVGTNTQSNGIQVFDIATNPNEPMLLSSIALPGGYVHDVYVRDNIAYCSHGGNGLYVYDFTDPLNPVLLGSLTDYVENGYNHSSWLSPDGEHLVFCDETFNKGVKLADVSDFSDMEVVDLFRSALQAPADTASVAHNAFIRGNLCFISYYLDGIQVFDISDPENVVRVAYYDTYPDNTQYGEYRGCWGVYPFFPSGVIVGSDMNNGLFVVSLDSLELDPITYPLYPNPELTLSGDADLCPGDTLIMQVAAGPPHIHWFNGDLPLEGSEGPQWAVSEAGEYWAYLENGHCFSLSDTISVQTHPNPEALISASALETCQGDSILLALADGPHTNTWFFNDQVLPFTTDSVQVYESGAYFGQTDNGFCQSVSDTLNLTFWAPQTPQISQISANTLACDIADAGSYQWYLDGQAIPGANSMEYTMEMSGVYSVEIVDANGCTGLSEPFEGLIISVNESFAAHFEVYPNPAFRELTIVPQQPESGVIRLINSQGIVLSTYPMGNTPSLTIWVGDLPEGMYFLAYEGLPVQKIVVTAGE